MKGKSGKHCWLSVSEKKATAFSSARKTAH